MPHAAAGPLSVSPRAFQLTAAPVHQRRQAANNTDGGRSADREREHDPVHARLIDERHPPAIADDEGATVPTSRPAIPASPKRAEQHAFGQELAGQAPSRRTQRKPGEHLAAPR